MQKPAWKKRSVFSRTLTPLLCVAVAELLIIFGMLLVGNTFGQLRSNALDMLEERSLNKQLSVRANFVNRWSSLSDTADAIRTTVQRGLADRHATPEDMKTNAELNASLLSDLAPTLVTSLRANGTTGLFFTLNGIGVKNQPDTWAGVYLRDADPGSVAADNSDLLLVRGLPPVSRQLGISLDSYWSATFTTAGGILPDYLLKPILAHEEGTSRVEAHYGYWHMPFSLNEGDALPIITYTMPVLSDEGDVLGILGIDLSVSYLTGLLNSGEFLRDAPGSYVLAVQQPDGSFAVAVAAGKSYKEHFLTSSETIVPGEWESDNTFTVRGSRSNEQIYGVMLDLELYGSNTPFSDEKWVLIGLQASETLMAFSDEFSTLLRWAALMSVVLCVVVAIIASKRISKPVTQLANQLKSSDPRGELTLSPTGITEIDLLADAIVRNHRDASDAASRLTTILELSGLRLGVFEIRQDSDMAYCSPGFLEALGCEDLPHHGDQIPRETCRQLLLDKFDDRIDDNVWRLRNPDGIRYLRLRQVQHGRNLIGTVMDVTEEIEEQYRAARELDYDSLTGIFNRRAFTRVCADLFENQRAALKTAAVVMLDLDNLKSLNDTYGHDVGDQYIRAFADGLSVFEGKGFVRARRSGDEFYMLLYGYDSRDELDAFLHAGWAELASRSIPLPDGSQGRFRFSGGLAWYPDDSDALQDLIHYADFAMYKVKQNTKGSLSPFDRRVYSEDAFLVNAREGLNRMIDEQLVHYAYQPIICARTGEVRGYELLMRPDVPELRNPNSVLRLAKAQGQLHHIERMTWFLALESARQMQREGRLMPGTKLFINSIANQVLSDEEEAYIVEHYGDLLSQVVLEVTESEDNNMDYTRRKLSFIRSHHGEVALDDFGTGYNSELALVIIRSDYVKLDVSFVRGVDSDSDKQALVRNLISYARKRDIAVLAEGVESRTEMVTLIAFGVDYIQGYYVGRPEHLPQDVDNIVRREIRALHKPTEAADAPDVPEI